MRTKWDDPADGPEQARPLDVILHGPPPPPPRPAPSAPPGLGGGPPPAPEEMAAIEDIPSGNRQEEEAARPTATPTTSAILEPRQDTRDDLESKVADLQRAVERNDDLVRDYQKYCDELGARTRNVSKPFPSLTMRPRSFARRSTSTLVNCRWSARMSSRSNRKLQASSKRLHG